MLRLDGLQPVWDKTIVDEARTTADFRVGEPIKREVLFTADAPWECGSINYAHTFKDGDIYRMYYLTHYKAQDDDNFNAVDMENVIPEKMTLGFANTFICYAESKDGLHWERPDLGLCSYNGNKHNNIILRSMDKPALGDFFDNIFVFKDTNPDCREDERYKALAYSSVYKLAGWVSPDGIHFREKLVYDIPGYFDTLNVCFFDERIGKYVAYVRSFHDIPADGDTNRGKRDVRCIESADFERWSTPKLIDFGEQEDYPLYTNNVMRYYRNPNIFIGFPTRYNERFCWTKSFDELCGRENRLQRMKQHPRMGLTIGDCVFMSSRDGKKWDRIDEAFFSPEPEMGRNWGYGDCYPAYYMLETTAADGVNKEISMMMPEQDVRNDLPSGERVPTKQYRWTIRRDGFAYYKGNYAGGKLVTKPFVFDGDELHINFATSARGGMRIKISDEDGNEAKTCELVGNSDDRRVYFEDAELADFAGKAVRLTFYMNDAKIYAFEFLKK